jgi:SAM-dependent methyltransferase
VATLKVEAVKRSLDVRCFVADLDYYPLPTAYYDLVIVFYFFDPKLVPAIISSLRPGGLVVYATYNYRHTSVKPEFNPAYLVPPRGLVPYFPGFETLIHEEEAGANANVSRFIGRRPPALTL